MKLGGIAIVVILLLLQVAVSEEYHHVGSSASGRASGANAQLESIIAQPVAGQADGLVSGFLATLAKPLFIPGDADGSGIIDISDPVYIMQYIFNGGPAPEPLIAGDTDCSGQIEITDAVVLIQYIFSSGPAPEYCY